MHLEISPFMISEVTLAIYGAGGLGREIFELAQRCNQVSKQWVDIVLIDDFREESEFFGTRTIQFNTVLKYKDRYACIVAVGEPSTRDTLFNKLIANNIKIVTLIDPSALISDTSRIGVGSIVCENSSIHCNTVIGNNCLIQPYSLLGHDVQIGDSSVVSAYFSPGGAVVIGKRVYVGMHASIKEKITVEDDSIIAMGACVFNNVPCNSVVVGNPARITKGNGQGKVFNS